LAGQAAREDATVNYQLSTVNALEALLTLCESEGYDFLLTRPTLLGLPDPRRIVPLLLRAARAEREERNVEARRSPRPRRETSSLFSLPASLSPYVRRLLATLGLADLEFHPGYQLRVFTLGTFEVYRGDELLDPREWKRDNARHLFQLLLTERGRWLQRDEIIERLWPERAPAAALQDFKVALNALMNALEPARPAAAPSSYVERDGTAYRLRPTADLYCDADDF
jgi:hypothetical protein